MVVIIPRGKQNKSKEFKVLSHSWFGVGKLEIYMKVGLGEDTWPIPAQVLSMHYY
jgi:hypothetical protein